MSVLQRTKIQKWNKYKPQNEWFLKFFSICRYVFYLFLLFFFLEK